MSIIYSACVAFWLSLVFAGIIELSRQAYIYILSPLSLGSTPSAWVNAIHELGRGAYIYFLSPHFLVSTPSAGVNAIALVLAIGVTYLGHRRIKKQSEKKEEELRKLAARAYKQAISREADEVDEVLLDDAFIKMYAELADDRDKDKRIMMKTKARATFYAGISPDSLGNYISLDSPELRAAHLVALLTDFPPLWVLKCGEGFFYVEPPSGALPLLTRLWDTARRWFHE